MQQVETPARRVDGHFFVVDGRHRDAAAFEAIRDFRRRQFQAENAVATRHVAGQIIFCERLAVAVDDATNLLRAAEFAQQRRRAGAGVGRRLRADAAFITVG